MSQHTDGYDSDDTQTPSSSRLQAIETWKSDVKGVVKVAVDALGIAANFTQDVPYLGAISSALTEFLKIQDEVSALKSDWKSVMNTARQIKAIVDNMRKQCTLEGVEKLPETLDEPFACLEKCIEDSLKTLVVCKVGSKRHRDRIVVWFQRTDLAREVKQCSKDMKSALNLFNTQVNWNTNVLVRAGSHGKQHDPRIPLSAKLRPPPAHFYGRGQEVVDIVDLVREHHSHVAILGSGGIGKTSIALTVLHDPLIAKVYSEWRVFVTCEATSSAEGVVFALLAAFNMAYDPKQSFSPQEVLVARLRDLPHTLLCLDNFETPWDSNDVRAVEELLASLASLPNLSLLVTIRGSVRPSSVSWARPFLPDIKPLLPDNAMRIWDGICDWHDDNSVQLVEAVDCIPLAVTLLATLARTESTQTLLSRWEVEHTTLLKTRGPGDRLSSLDTSIKLSLHGPRLRGEPNTVLLLSIICLLPQGLRESCLVDLGKALAQIIPNLQASIVSLKQCSLIYLSEDGFLRSLSPIVHYMRANHRVPDRVLTPLAAFYTDIVQIASSDSESATTYTREHIQKELGNITAVLKHGLELDTELLRSSLKAILWFVQYCHRFHFYELDLLDFAIEFVRNENLDVKFPLLLTKAEGLYLSTQFGRAIPVYSQVCEHYRSNKDLPREGLCLARLGDVYYWHGQYDEAKDSLMLAMNIFEKSGMADEQAFCQLHLGIIYTVLGLLDQAEILLRSAHDTFKTHTSGSCLETSAWALGTLHIARYQLDSAEQQLLSSLALSRSANNTLNQANCLQSLGHLYTLQLMCFPDAEEALKSAQNLYDRIGNRRGVAECLGRLGQLYAQMDKFDLAESCLQSAIELHANLDHPLGKATALNALGNLYRVLGRYDGARGHLLSALETSAKMPYAIGQGDALLALGKVQGHNGELHDAAESFSEALKAFERAQDSQKAWLAHEYLEDILRRLKRGYESSLTGCTAIGGKGDGSVGALW